MLCFRPLSTRSTSVLSLNIESPSRGASDESPPRAGFTCKAMRPHFGFCRADGRPWSRGQGFCKSPTSFCTPTWGATRRARVHFHPLRYPMTFSADILPGARVQRARAAVHAPPSPHLVTWSIRCADPEPALSKTDITALWMICILIAASSQKGTASSSDKTEGK